MAAVAAAVLDGFPVALLGCLLALRPAIVKRQERVLQAVLHLRLGLQGCSVAAGAKTCHFAATSQESAAGPAQTAAAAAAAAAASAAAAAAAAAAVAAAAVAAAQSLAADSVQTAAQELAAEVA